MSGVIIGGIGNVLCGDDAAGPTLIHQLSSLYEFPESVRLVDFGTPGLDFVVQISGLDALILIDASDNGLEAGSIAEYDKNFILASPVPMRLDPHQPALKESLWICDIDGQAPREVVLIGITGQSYEMHSPLSPAVRAALQPAAAVVLRHLERLQLAARPIPGAHCESPWWET